MLVEIDKEKTGLVDILEWSKICFNVKEEKVKEKKDYKPKPAKK